jgi:hypothetical protein
VLIAPQSSILYGMRTERPSNHALKLALATLALVALAAAACSGNNSSPASGSPSPGASVVASVTPGSGVQPITAITSYISANGLDGQQLSPTTRSDCPVQEELATPGVSSTLAVGQFCLIAKDVEPEKAMTIVLQLPDTGESWEMKLEYNADVSLWEIKDVNKVNG